MSPGRSRWIPPHRRLGLEVPQPGQPKGVHHPSDGRERDLEGPGDKAKRAALVPEVHGLLQLLRRSAGAVIPPERYRASHL
jgi:hypothetical protein